MRRLSIKALAVLMAVLMVAAILPAITSADIGTDGVYIVEYYAGGGSGETANYYNNDYILLRNSAAEDVDLAGWSIQYLTSSKNAAQVSDVYALSGSITAGGYYLIKCADGSKKSQDLPFGAETECSLNIAVAEIKLVLAKTTTPVSGLTNANIPTNTNIADFVGTVGASQELYLGTGGAPKSTNTRCITRTAYTNDNATDWKQADTGAYPILKAVASLGEEAGVSTAAEGSIAGWTFGIKGIDGQIPTTDAAYTQSMNVGQQVHFNGTITGGKFYSHGTTTLNSQTYTTYAYGTTNWDFTGESSDTEKGFYFSIYTTGYRNVAISFWAESSKAGPKTLQVQVKIDGVWTDVPGAKLTLDTAATGKTLTTTAINLPCWNSTEIVDMRILRVGTESCEEHDGGITEITSSGSCRIDDLMITGVKMAEGEVLLDAPGPITASPDPSQGSICQGTLVTLTCETADAVIYYKAGANDYQTVANGGTITVYNGAPISAYGYIENAYGGDATVFDYTIDNTHEEMGACTGTGPVVIEQIYGQGGNKGSLYTSDYIVLRNISEETVDLENWSLLFISQNQPFSTTQAATRCYTFTSGVSIRAHGYLLIQCAAGISQVGAYDLQDVDVMAVNSTSDGDKYLTISATGGKLALVEDSNLCEGSNDPNLVDMVCWGSPNDYLGNGPASGTPDVLYCLTRANDAEEGEIVDPFGGSYTGDNARDFVVSWPNPKNSISAGNMEEYIEPITSPQEETLIAGTPVELLCDTADATIYYTIDGGATYNQYTQPITTTQDTLTIRAFAERIVNGNTIRSDYYDFGFVFLAADGSYNIRQARALQEGSEVTVTGTVTFVETNSYGTITTFTMQDDTAGITVRGYSSQLKKVEIGKIVTISGIRSSYRGLEQIINPKIEGDVILSKMPTPIVATASQLINTEWAEAHESMYVVVKNARMDTINYTGGYGGTPPATAIIDDTGVVNIHYLPTLDNIIKGDIVDTYAVLTQNAQDLIAYSDGYYLRIAYQDWIVLVERPTEPVNEYTIAAWNQGTGSGTHQMLASDGAYAWSSVVSNGDAEGNTTTYPFGTSKSSMNCKGWNNEGRYLQFELSTKGFTDVVLSAKLRASGAGPRNFIMQYSLDGTTFEDIEGSNFAVVHSDVNDALMQLINRYKLPEELCDQEKLYIRWVLTDNMRSDGTGEIASVGSLNFTAVQFIGTMIPSELDVAANPDAGEVPINQMIDLSCADDTATIYYRRYVAPVYEEDEDEGDLVDRTHDNWIAFDVGSPVELTELPYTLQAYAANQTDEGRVFTFDYTQSKCAPVKSTAYTGALKADKEITLSTATLGATINATVIYNFGTAEETTADFTSVNEYTTSFSEDQFPVHIEAYASMTGYLDSEVLVINFTLKQTGGEQLYFGQIHSHTTLSDGVGSIEDAFSYGKNTAKNLDYLIITDHSNYLDSKSNLGTMDGKNLGTATSYVDDSGNIVTISKWELGHMTADKYTDSTFVADFGYEMTWSGQYGHMNTYATDGFVSRNNGTYTISGGQGLRNYYDLLTEYPQSISMFNHPGSTFGTFDDFAYYTEEYDQVIKLIEVGNGEGATTSSGYWPSYEQFTRALDKGWHIAPANNQDNHKGKWGDANTARDVAWTNDFTQNGILQAMREMRMYATEDNNLQVTYFINDEPLGTIFDTKPAALDFAVTVYDPDVADKSFTLSIIANNGKTVYSQSGVIINNEPCVFNFTLAPDYSYYYVRIDQSDSNIAVTAPIWVGDVMKVGVESLTTDADFAVVGESLMLSARVFNDEAEDFAISNITYSVNDVEFANNDMSRVVAGGSEYTDTIGFTPSTVGAQTFMVEVTGVILGQEYTFSATLELNVLSPDDIVNIALDASHNNYYVSGYASEYYKQLELIAKEFNGMVTLIEGAITAQSLSNIDLLIITAPYQGWNNNGRAFTSTELAAISAFGASGGNVLVTGKSERGDSATAANASLNTVLDALGTDTKLRVDTVIDLAHSSNSSYNITFDSEANYQFDSRLLAGVQQSSTGNFVYYAGSSVNAASTASAVIKGTATTMGTAYANLDSEAPYLPIDANSSTVSGSATTLVSSETLSGGGLLVVSGMSFFNDYQIPEVENTAEVRDVNYYLTRNIIMSAIETTPISEVRKSTTGVWFAIEGTVTTNASGHDVNTAFFDSIYVQDATGGINLFPVSGDLAIGQKVWACGFVGNYQGDYQMNDVQIYVIDSSIDPIDAQYNTTMESMENTSQGKLIYIEGAVESVSYNEGAVEYIMVNDGSGTSRVFIDGYIYCDCAACQKNAAGHDLSWIEVGSKVRITGIASTGMHPDETGLDQLLPRIRVRNRAEIVKIDSFTPHTGGLAGDADCNGEVTAADAALILRWIVKIAPISAQGMINAEVTNDSEITAADAAAILRWIVHIEPVLPLS